MTHKGRKARRKAPTQIAVAVLLTLLGAYLPLASGPRQMVKIGLNYSFWGVFGSPKPPVAWERALGTYLVVGAWGRVVWDSNGIFPLKWPGGAHPAYPIGVRGVCFGGLVRSSGSLNEPFGSYEPVPGPSGCHASTYTRHHTPNTAHFFHLKKAIFGVHPRSFNGHFRPLGVGNQQG